MKPSVGAIVNSLWNRMSSPNLALISRILTAAYVGAQTPESFDQARNLAAGKGRSSLPVG